MGHSFRLLSKLSLCATLACTAGCGGDDDACVGTAAIARVSHFDLTHSGGLPLPCPGQTSATHSSQSDFTVDLDGAEITSRTAAACGFPAHEKTVPLAAAAVSDLRTKLAELRLVSPDKNACVADYGMGVIEVPGCGGETRRYTSSNSDAFCRAMKPGVAADGFDAIEGALIQLTK